MHSTAGSCISTSGGAYALLVSILGAGCQKFLWMEPRSGWSIFVQLRGSVLEEAPIADPLGWWKRWWVMGERVAA